MLVGVCLGNLLSAQCSCESAGGGVAGFSESTASFGLKKGVVFTELAYDYRGFHAKSSSAHHTTSLDALPQVEMHHIQQVSLSTFVGVNTYLFVGVQQAIIDMYGNYGLVRGTGDLSLQLGWNVFPNSCTGTTLLLSAGAELPTGMRTRYAAEPQMALATGASDPFAQVIFRKKLRSYFVQFSASHKYTIYDSHYTRLSRLSRTRLLMGREFESGLAVYWGLNAEFSGNVLVSGSRIKSYSHIYSSMATLTWATKSNWRLGVQTSLPIIQNQATSIQRTSIQLRLFLSKSINFKQAKSNYYEKI